MFFLNRYTVRASGPMTFEELGMTKYGSPLLQFGENVLACKILEDKATWPVSGRLAFGWDHQLRRTGTWSDAPPVP